MKRKPTAKNVRVGQTLYYAIHAMASRKSVHEVGQVVVVSDRLDGVVSLAHNGKATRKDIAKHLAAVPGDFSYSRRNVERFIREESAKYEKERRARAEWLNGHPVKGHIARVLKVEQKAMSRSAK